ncbi:probable LRR receptor-like serine/threonine-protein kinase RFK1 [Hevea brasiliensis]|uniref:probable LRR receptor-like serine/threonine-protein kinase RFK1 n=1 Tax=Hevea brasiliensis TaxID=3981 RepID=UPI0025E07F30|nr:probable LRR receptor-like serine/threonine-protein kinase RFK1 [Hevea brasiliensis]
MVQLVDETLKSEVSQKQAVTMVKAVLLDTNASPTIRPTMSEVVNMLEGRMAIPDTILEPSSYAEDLRFKATRDLRQHSQRLHGSQTLNLTAVHTYGSSSTSDQEFYEINPGSKP